MIFIDAREGLSGDTLLAAMLGLLDDQERLGVVGKTERVAERLGLEFRLLDIDEAGEQGLGIAYKELAQGLPEERSYDACFSLLTDIQNGVGTEDAKEGRSILRLIFEAEGRAHMLPPEEVHLHEIGRPQAILNIALIGHLSARLRKTGGPFVCSTIMTGSGIVVVSHGAVRIPPPASVALLEGMKHERGDSPGERATPTGIASVKALIERQTDDVPANVRRKSIGFGTRRFAGRLGRTTIMLA